jgi:nucleosome binding factor SPN SPT16 subunit
MREWLLVCVGMGGHKVVEFMGDHKVVKSMGGHKVVKTFVLYYGMSSLQTADARRSAYDPDELEEEQRDRERRKRINLEFKRFVKRVQDAWDKDFPRLKLEWDMPYRYAAEIAVPAST